MDVFLDLGENGLWGAGSSSEEEEAAPDLGTCCICRPSVPLQGTALTDHMASQAHRDTLAQLCDNAPGLLHVHENGRGILCDTAPGQTICSTTELEAHLQSPWHSFNLKRLTASARVRASHSQRAHGAVTREEYDRLAALPRRWDSKTARIRVRQGDASTSSAQPASVARALTLPFLPRPVLLPPTAPVTKPATPAPTAPAAPTAPPGAQLPGAQRQASWIALIDVRELVLRVACEDPFSQAACACTTWRDTYRHVQHERWCTLKSSLPARRAAADEERARSVEKDPVAASSLDVQLATEIARLVSSFGTAGSTKEKQLPPPPSFDFDRARKLLQSGAGTGAIAHHCTYVAGGWAGVEWYDPEDAPLNTAALFIGVAASLESLGRSGASAAHLDARVVVALDLFQQLAVAPGNALEDDVFSVSVRFYHEYEECFGNVTAMCRSLYRTACLYDAGDRVDRLHAKQFPLPGGNLRLELTVPHALRFAWSVFESQSLIESLSPGRTRPGGHFGAGSQWIPLASPLPSSTLSVAAFDLFLAPSARSLFACPELDPKRAVPPQETPERRRHPARRHFSAAVRLLRACGTLSVHMVKPSLERWGECLLPPPRREDELGGGAEASAGGGRLALGVLRLPRLIGALLGDGRAADEQEVLDLLPTLSSHLWEKLVLSDTCLQWDDLMGASSPIRTAMLRTVPSLPFELVRRRDAGRLRTLLSADPALAGSFRCQCVGLDWSYWLATASAPAKSRVARGLAWDLMAATCSGRGLTHQMVSSMLRSRAFVACGCGSMEAVAAARLACVAAARAVRNRKTDAVLRGAWGLLIEARLSVAAADGMVCVALRWSCWQ